ncbi:peptide/nickel transport system substrate-binding protein [Antricoccus suffuscus]|uniref:Peptide/nickel transport system substrate-binding protein n=1 Tax=Antricoccus suffuscus TaxID=1629062 RepID=A0A2T1A604_9ACTN|nr:ABC transporter substrate-binding protein [Antricoccus suffuscus]PRZ44043.1 peptide/nickel transport system substrate-binding protein [Antricoccus suffuscus]
MHETAVIRSTHGMRRSRLRTLAVVITLFSLLLAACGGGTGATDKPGGTLKVAVATDVQTFDPQMAAVAQEYYLNPVFDTLIHALPDGTYEAALAEKWEIITPTTFELQLRPDVKFSDGTPVDVQAVVANFERGIAMTASPSAAFYSNITSAEAVNDSTVRLNLVHPTTDMLSQLTRLPGMMMSPASFDADPDTKPIGAGGWVYDAAASNAGEVQVYQANPDYWDPKRVKVDTVELRLLADASAATNAILDGQVDVIEMRAESDRATLDSGSLQLIERANANVYYMQIMDTDGTLLKPMADPRVRKALNLGIDRKAFNKGLQFGNGNPSPSFWLPDTPYYDKSLEDLAYDPVKAKKLLAEAGYSDGFSVTLPTFGALTEVAESVQQMWGNIGITVELNQVEPGTLASVMRNGSTVMTPTIARGFTAESQYSERNAPGGAYDPLKTDRGDLAALAEKAFNGETEEQQSKGWRDVYTYLIDQGYMIVIGHQIPTVVVGKNVSGVQLAPSDNVPKPYDITVV